MTFEKALGRHNIVLGAWVAEPLCFAGFLASLCCASEVGEFVL
jgi:hypothetical protein